MIPSFIQSTNKIKDQIMSNVETNQQTKTAEIETDDYEIPSSIDYDSSFDSDTQQYLKSIGKTIWLWIGINWTQATIVHFMEDGAVVIVRFTEEQQNRLYDVYRLINAEFVISEDKPIYTPEHVDDDDDNNNDNDNDNDDESPVWRGERKWRALNAIMVNNKKYLLDTKSNEVFCYEIINGINEYVGKYDEINNKIIVETTHDDSDYTPEDENFDGDGYQRGLYFQTGCGVINLSPEDLAGSQFTLRVNERKGHFTFTWR